MDGDASARPDAGETTAARRTVWRERETSESDDVSQEEGPGEDWTMLAKNPPTRFIDGKVAAQRAREAAVTSGWRVGYAESISQASESASIQASVSASARRSGFSRGNARQVGTHAEMSDESHLTSGSSSGSSSGKQRRRYLRTSGWRQGEDLKALSGLKDPWDDDDEDEMPTRFQNSKWSDTNSTSDSSSSDENGEEIKPSLRDENAIGDERVEEPGEPPKLAPLKMLTRQDHIRHVDEDDIEYYTESDSDDSVLYAGKRESSDDGEDEEDEEDEENEQGEEAVENGEGDDDDQAKKTKRKKKKKKKKKKDRRGSITPPMSPKSKARYRCIKGELKAAKARTAILREKHAAVKYLLSSEDSESKEKVLSDELSTVVLNASKEISEIDADLRIRTSLFAKTNGLSALPVCTCNELAVTRIGKNQHGSLAAYCQVHMPFATAKMGKYGTSHSGCDAEEATRRLRAIYTEEKAAEEKRKAKALKLQEARRDRGYYKWNRDDQAPHAGDSDDSDWDLNEIIKTSHARKGGPPLVIPNPHIERAKQRIAEIREAHGYQIFETRSNYVLVTNNASKSLFRVAKIERFSDEFRVDEDSHLYSRLQVENLLHMTATTQGGCRRVGEGRGVVGFIQLYAFHSTTDSGMDFDALNERHQRGDVVRITEEIYRRHIWAMKRRELMFSFLERTKTARGVPSHVHQLGPHQGYTIFSGVDSVRPLGTYGSTMRAIEAPKSSTVDEAPLAINAVAQQNLVEEEKTNVEEQSNWYTSLLAHIDEAIDEQDQEKRKRAAKKLTKEQAEEQAERLRQEKLREEEEAAARAVAEVNWTTLILEGFMTPQIPTEHALPGQLTQVEGANKFIYRTKYLAIFRDIVPSEDEASDGPFSISDSEDTSSDEEVHEAAHGSTMTEQIIDMLSFGHSKGGHPTGAKDEKKNPIGAKDEKKNTLVQWVKGRFLKKRGDHPTGEKKIGFDLERSATESQNVNSEKRPGETSQVEALSAAAPLGQPRPIKLTRKLTHSSSQDALFSNTSAVDTHPNTPKSPRTPKFSKSDTGHASEMRRNTVKIESNDYKEDYYASDSEPDYESEEDSYELTDESSDTDDDVEFVEYTLIERILIFLGFLEDKQGKKKRSYDSSEEQDAARFKSESNTANGTAETYGKSNVTSSKSFQKAGREQPSADFYTKKDTVNGAPKTLEEIKAEIERRKIALEAREKRRARRAEIRAERAKERRKMQARIDRYKWDETQDVVKLRFKAFGGHAPVLL